MTYNDFVKSRFKSAQDTVNDLIEISGDVAQMLHASMGMSGELIEIELAESRANLIEELGDYWFYYRAVCEMPACGVPNDLRVTVGEVSTDLKRATNDILDIAKKLAIYRKEMTPSLQSRLRGAIQTIALQFPVLVNRFGLTMEQVEAENQFKLTKRYPVGYSNEAAQARADKAGE